MEGIINVKYTIKDLRFDAAIDYGRILHPYTYNQRQMLPVELYCYDNDDWDITMIFFPDGAVKWDEVIEHTIKWINEMTKDERY